MIAITTNTPYDPTRQRTTPRIDPRLASGNIYRNADAAPSPAPTTNGWAFTDKLFGVLDKAGSVYNEIRYPIIPSPGDANYEEYLAWRRTQNQMLFGLPSPLGAILLIGGIGLVGFIVYKVIK